MKPMQFPPTHPPTCRHTHTHTHKPGAPEVALKHQISLVKEAQSSDLHDCAENTCTDTGGGSPGVVRSFLLTDYHRGRENCLAEREREGGREGERM